MPGAAKPCVGLVAAANGLSSPKFHENSVGSSVDVFVKVISAFTGTVNADAVNAAVGGPTGMGSMVTVFEISLGPAPFLTVSVTV